ncbi:MAG: DUF2326 domain-containing protein [Melioribacteraceae bacterium]
MILKKIYTSPKQLFKPVEFVDGINYIFGKKEVGPDGHSKKSLNGIGKSLLLDLINFCFLCDYNRRSTPRLIAAYNKNILKDISVVLEFEIGKDYYKIIRSFAEPSTILLSVDNSPLSKYNITELKLSLCNLFFERTKYEGKYSSTWLRKLIPFFIKIQTPEKVPFVNPVKYINELSETELIQFHFFLLNLNNTLLARNFELLTELKQLNTTLKRISKLLDEVYGTKTTEGFSSHKKKLSSEIDKLIKAVQSFKLSEKYKIDEDKADKLTAEIKELWSDNSSDNQEILSLQESLKVNTSIKPNSIARIYNELNNLLGKNIEKSLSDAVEFRKNLITSRLEFISTEVDRLSNLIIDRMEIINSKEQNRSEILSILNNKKAFNDLTEAYYQLSIKQDELKELESRTKLFDDLNKKKLEIKKNINIISQQLYELKEHIAQKELIISSVISDIYNNIYPEHPDSSVFEITPSPNLEAKIKLNILTSNEMLSHGMNQGRTMIYDLAVLFHAIQENLKTPRFLIHDGILDSMDKTHFIELVKYLKQRQKNGEIFQYIITLNEEGTLKDNFEDGDIVNPDKIAEEAILVLTPYKKLFQLDF